MSMSAVEKGRSLVVTIGDEDEGDDLIVVKIKPVPAKVGAELYALWLGITFGTPISGDDGADEVAAAENDAEKMGALALGQENWHYVEMLRSGEVTLLINAAIMWNIQGGGIHLVNMIFNEGAGGLPKARQMLLSANGHLETFKQLMTYLSSASDAATQSQDGTNATSTQTGSGSAFRKPASKTKTQ